MTALTLPPVAAIIVLVVFAAMLCLFLWGVYRAGQHHTPDCPHCGHRTTP